jgi:hypothetical protein
LSGSVTDAGSPLTAALIGAGTPVVEVFLRLTDESKVLLARFRTRAERVIANSLVMSSVAALGGDSCEQAEPDRGSTAAQDTARDGRAPTPASQNTPQHLHYSLRDRSFDEPRRPKLRLRLVPMSG